MKCINVQCQKEIGNMLFCPYCGTKQVKPKVFCAFCGAEMDEDAIFCDNCGRKSYLVQQREEAELEEQKRLAQEAERKRLEEVKKELATEWKVLDDPNLEFRLIDATDSSLVVKATDQASRLTQITVPSCVWVLGEAYKVTALADGAFSNCAALKSIVLPNDLEKIPSRAFKNCSSLSTIELPETVTEIGVEAFEGAGLDSIILPSSVEQIDYEAFRGCWRLSTIEFQGIKVNVRNTSFDLTPFVKTLEYKSLVGSNTIVNVSPTFPELNRLENENQFISRDFPYLLFIFSAKSSTFTVTKRKGYDLPSVLTIPRKVSVGNYFYPVINIIGFESSNTLEKLVIPAPGDKINVCKKAFAGCEALESVEIDSQTITVYSGAFENCTKLKEVELKFYEQPHLSVFAFSGCSALPMMKRLKLVKYNDVKVDLASIKLDLPSFLKNR